MNSSLLEKILSLGIFRIWFKLQKVRVGLQRILPRNPLSKGSKLPQLIVIIPCHSKDFWKLPLAVEALVHNSENPLLKVVVIHEASTKVPKDVRKINLVIEFVDEDEIVNVDIRHLIEDKVPKDRYGWTIQQIATWEYILKSQGEHFLRLDADTFLVQKRAFFDEKQHLLFPVTEYEERYDRALALVGKANISGLSFVSHHQPIFRTVLEKMVSNNRNTFYEEWLSQMKFMDRSASEYHTYGNYILKNFPHMIRLAYWGNVRFSEATLHKLLDAFSSTETLKKLKELGDDIFSVSAHHYVVFDDVDDFTIGKFPENKNVFKML